MAGVSVVPHAPKHGGEFEHLHVQSVYDEIAPCMNDIEHKAWPNVKRFLKKMPPGSVVADIGCGNGRYLNINKSVYKLGIDMCLPLVDHARSKGHEVSYADNLHIPYRDGVCDGVVSVGVIHHFCSHERRVVALQELSRILRRGGKLMLYVWAYEQKRRKFESQDVLIPWHENSRYGKRLGSTSSTHSSQGALSAGGSFSEDDTSDLPGDASSIPDIAVESVPDDQAKPNSQSVSLDDLSNVSVLSNFKPSYYSLEFNVSPRHMTKPWRKDKYVWNDKTRHSSHREHRNTLIQECRKLEASLRAMSSGSLDEMNKQPFNCGDIGKPEPSSRKKGLTHQESISCENLPYRSEENQEVELRDNLPNTSKKQLITGVSADLLPCEQYDNERPERSRDRTCKGFENEIENVDKRSETENDDNNADLSGNVGDMSGSHGNLSSSRGNLSRSPSELHVNLDWNLGGLDYEDFEGEMLDSVIVDSGYSEKLSDEFEVGSSASIFNNEARGVGKSFEDVRGSLASETDPNGLGIGGNLAAFVGPQTNGSGISRISGHQQHHHKTKGAQINPFLKQDSMEQYTFNNVLNNSHSNNQNHTPVEDPNYIDVIYETDETFECPDKVSVGYKLPRKQSTTTSEKSLFSSFKSKVLGIFDDKDNANVKGDPKEQTNPENGMKKNQSFNNTKEVSENITSNKLKKFPDMGRTLSKPDFTEEQLELVNKLNFQVREFPLSSCAETGKTDVMENKAESTRTSSKVSNDTTTNMGAKPGSGKENCNGDSGRLSTRCNGRKEVGLPNFSNDHNMPKCSNGRHLPNSSKDENMPGFSNGNGSHMPKICNSDGSKCCNGVNMPTLSNDQGRQCMGEADYKTDVRNYSKLKQFENGKRSDCDHFREVTNGFSFRNDIRSSGDSCICEVIYDSYIKLDFDKISDGGGSETLPGHCRLRGDNCALKSNRFAKTDCAMVGDCNMGDTNKPTGIFDTNSYDDATTIRMDQNGDRCHSDKCYMSSCHQCDSQNKISQNGCAITKSTKQCNIHNENAQTNRNTNSSQGGGDGGRQTDVRRRLSRQGSISADRDRSSNLRTSSTSSTKGTGIDEHNLSSDDVVFDLGPVASEEAGSEADAIPQNGAGVSESAASRLSRYYHVFKEGELEKLISTYVTDLQVVQCFYDHANWCVIAEKL